MRKRRSKNLGSKIHGYKNLILSYRVERRKGRAFRFLLNLGSKNFGSRNLGSKNLGSKNLGNKNYGNKNLGSKNLGSKNFGNKNL